MIYIQNMENPRFDGPEVWVGVIAGGNEIYARNPNVADLFSIAINEVMENTTGQPTDSINRINIMPEVQEGTDRVFFNIEADVEHASMSVQAYISVIPEWRDSSMCLVDVNTGLTVCTELSGDEVDLLTTMAKSHKADKKYQNPN